MHPKEEIHSLRSSKAKSLAQLTAGTLVGAVATYVAVLGGVGLIKTAIHGRTHPDIHPQYAQEQENNRWYLGLGGLGTIGGAYLATRGLKNLRETLK